MMRRYLIDTNLLVYPHDSKDLAKQSKADTVLKNLLRTKQGAISIQALAEFANVTIKKYKLHFNDVYQAIEGYEQAFEVLPLTSIIVLEAVRGVRDYKFSYFDAQIWATAKLNHIPYILSEDFNQTTIEGITFINPFGQNFDPENL